MAQEPEVNGPVYATQYVSINEPVSGFSTALQNVYSHVLETFISVLSSISSHILHSIFYNVIEEVISGKNVPEGLKRAGGLRLSNHMSSHASDAKSPSSSKKQQKSAHEGSK